MAFAIATVSVVSCDKKEKKEATTALEGHDHKEGDAHQLTYICPMDCEKGKTYSVIGKCPTCDMDLVEQKHKESDGHDHSTTKELTPEEKEHGHSHNDEGHEHK